ncbi:MAG: farnesyl diphosphate synthase [Pseudohongiellaceae bacterium]
MTTDYSLSDFFQTCQQRVETTITGLLTTVADGQVDLHRAMEYATLKGGKRVRPLLAYGGVLAAGGELPQADAAACAVELIHSYSLVHDDLPSMDNDDLRRGIPTVHRAFGEAMAILTGDALQALAFQVLAQDFSIEFNSKQQLRMIARLSQASGANGMVAGQALDFSAIGKSLDLQQLQSMHSLKTGALISASVILGALSHPAVKESQLPALESYARSVGLAFQIQDDILDVTAETGTLGKPQGSDRAQNKPTYTSLLGVEGARQKATDLARLAVQSLEPLPASADMLRQLADYIVERMY